MIFETERLFVDKWKAGDLKTLHELFGDEAIKELILPKLTVEETLHIFEEQLIDYDEHLPFGRYFIYEKLNNQAIGLLLIKKDKKKVGVEIGYSLKKEHWNKGYATEIVQESIYWLIEHKKISNIYAVTETDNINSHNVLFKCGFIQQENFIEDGKEMSLFGLKM